jgi:hypothetical protein
VKKWVFALVIGIMLALATGADVSDDVIKCGSEIMYPGDVCEETRGGATTDTQTYEEMKESSEARTRMFETWGRWVFLGVGLLLATAGLTGILATRKRRAAAAAAQPQAVVPQAAPHHGMPPQFVPPQRMPNAPYPQAPNQQYPQHPPYHQQMPPQQPYPPQQQYPPQGFGPTGHHDQS